MASAPVKFESALALAAGSGSFRPSADLRSQEIYRSLSGELDPVRRAAKFIRLNKLIIDNRVAIPLVNRPESGAAAHRLRMTLSAWDSHLWLLKDWYREG